MLVSKESVLPIDRIKLSKSTKFEVDKLLLRSPKYFDEAAIQVKLGTSATHLDTASQNITLSSGEKLHYDKLLIATGADPRNFWPNSAAMNNVVVLRGFDDAAKLEAAVAANPKPRIVTVGSSFIAMEAAATFVKTAESVVVIGMEKVPFERVLGEKIGAAMQKLHEEKGVQFKMNAVVDTFETADGGASCSGLKLKTGEFIPADIVIIGAGVVPATAAFKTALNIEKDGSIVADEYLAVVGQQNIYIAGNFVSFPLPFACFNSYPQATLPASLTRTTRDRPIPTTSSASSTGAWHNSRAVSPPTTCSMASKSSPPCRTSGPTSMARASDTAATLSATMTSSSMATSTRSSLSPSSPVTSPKKY